MARKTRIQELENEDDFEEVEAAPERGSARMIDWLQCCKLPVMFSVAGYFALSGFLAEIAKGNMTWATAFSAAMTIPRTQDEALAAAGVVLVVTLIILGPLALLSQLMGFSFNATQDRLSYPLYVFRRKVQLSEIQDANCQTITKPAFHITNTIIGMISIGKIKGLGNTKRYIVNMSGDFGARRIIFHTKYKRDQYLSLLRRFAPDCRITRWV